MIKFACPFSLTDLNQIPYKEVSLYNLDLEGVCFDNNILLGNIKKIKNNLKVLHRKMPNRIVSMHYPTDNANYVDSKAGYNNLLKFIKIASDFKIKKLILHSNFLISANNFDQSKLGGYREKFHILFRKLDKHLDNTSTTLLIENMPVIGNNGNDFDSIFIFPEDFREFGKYKNIKIAWDLCHWASTFKLLKDVARFSSRTSKVSIDFREYLVLEKYIKHFHLSSFRTNTFINTGSTCYEGVPPDQGDIDEGYFVDSLKIIKKKKELFHVSLEINESDYQNRKNLRKTLLWLRRNNFINYSK